MKITPKRVEERFNPQEKDISFWDILIGMEKQERDERLEKTQLDEEVTSLYGLAYRLRREHNAKKLNFESEDETCETNFHFNVWGLEKYNITAFSEEVLKPRVIENGLREFREGKSVTVAGEKEGKSFFLSMEPSFPPFFPFIYSYEESKLPDEMDEEEYETIKTAMNALEIPYEEERERIRVENWSWRREVPLNEVGKAYEIINESGFEPEVSSPPRVKFRPKNVEVQLLGSVAGSLPRREVEKVEEWVEENVAPLKEKYWKPVIYSRFEKDEEEMEPAIMEPYLFKDLDGGI